MSEQLYSKIGEYTPDSLITSTKVSIITRGIQLEPNQGILKRGSLIGKKNDNTFALMGSEDGMLVEGILTDDIDTDLTNVSTVYITGCFNREAIIVSEMHMVEEYERELRNLNIYLDEVLK